MAHFSIQLCTKALGRKTRIDLVIPSLNLHGSLNNKDDNYYCNNQVKYPLLICLHGFGEDEKTWQNSCNMIRFCEEHQVAAVFINGENKWYLNMSPIEDFYNLIERDVLDYLYGNFSCLSKDMPLAICGNSMGGYGALYHYFKNPSKYTCAIALSPATKPDFIDESKYGTLRELALEASKTNKLNVYLSIGENDFIIEPSRELDKFFIDNNVGVSYKYIPGANHSWTTWAKEVEHVCDYLLKINFAK